MKGDLQCAGWLLKVDLICPCASQQADMFPNEGLRYFLVAFVFVVSSIPFRDVVVQLLGDTRWDEAMASVGVARIFGFHPKRGETITHVDILSIPVLGTFPGGSMSPSVESLATDDVTGAATADETKRN